MGENGKPWFAVYTKPRQEQVALENLQRQGFTCFLPLADNPYQRRRQSRRSEPLFPRYLFLNAMPGRQSLAPVRSTRGVASLVRFGTRLANVPETIIRAIRSRIDEDSGLVKLEPVPVEPGDNVEVFDGPLAGLKGLFQARKGVDRALLLTSFLGGEQTIAVDALHLKRVV